MSIDFSIVVRVIPNFTLLSNKMMNTQPPSRVRVIPNFTLLSNGLSHNIDRPIVRVIPNFTLLSNCHAV